MFTIYTITNKINGLRYVGMTSRDPEVRFAEHLRGDTSRKLAAALREFGPDAFSLDLLEQTPLKKAAEYKEMLYTLKFDSVRNGYNSAIGNVHEPAVVLAMIRNFTSGKPWLACEPQ